LIRAKQLRGLQKDPITGESKGVISVKGKGGKIRDIRVSPEIYSRLEQKIEWAGLFQFNRAKYQTAIKEVVQNIREVGYGTHGFRWNWAQGRFKLIQQKGFTYEQALSLVSQEMGHERADITEHYLK
jgi:integrase